MEKKTNQKIQEINKSLKESKETQEKNNQTSEGSSWNSSRHENWYRNNKENIEWGDAGNRKAG